MMKLGCNWCVCSERNSISAGVISHRVTTWLSCRQCAELSPAWMRVMRPHVRFLSPVLWYVMSGISGGRRA